METPSIWLGVSNQILGLWMGFRVPLLFWFWVPFKGKGFGVLWKQGKVGILGPIPYVFDETPNNQLLRFLVHLIYIRIFERNHVHISVVPFVFFFLFCLSPVSVRLSLEFRVSLQSFRMLGFAVPVLVRREEEKRWDLLPHVSLQWDPLVSRVERDISSATSLGKTSMEIDQVKILSSIGEKREVEILLP